MRIYSSCLRDEFSRNNPRGDKRRGNDLTCRAMNVISRGLPNSRNLLTKENAIVKNARKRRIALQTFRIFILKAGASRQSQEIVKLVTASVSSLFYLWNCPTFAENRGYSRSDFLLQLLHANSHRSLTEDRSSWIV